MNTRFYFYGTGLLVLLLLGAWAGKQIILGGANPVTLAAAPPLSGVIAQSLYTGQQAAPLPVPGTDFNLADVHYFDNDSWATASIQPLHNQFDPGIVVLEKRSGAFQVVLGPGSAFDSTYLASLPKDVGQYLQSKGVIYESLD